MSNEKEEKSLNNIKAILNMSEEDIKRNKQKCNESSSENNNNGDNMKELLREIFTEAVDDNQDDDESYDSSIDNSSVEVENQEPLIKLESETIPKNYILTSPLGIRVQQLMNVQTINAIETSTIIPYDFLRIPNTHAVKIPNPKLNKSMNTTEWVLLSKLQNNITRETLIPNVFTKVIIRDKNIGLGMTIHEKGGNIQIHALVCQDSSRIHYSLDGGELEDAIRNNNAGPAQLVGIRPCDRLVGVNGIPLLNKENSVVMLKSAVRMIMNTPDPVVLHLTRVNDTKIDIPDLLDTDIKPQPQDKLKKPTAITIHPLAKACTSRSILRTSKDESIVTIQLNQFTERVEQWESTNFIRFDPITKALKPILDKSELPYSDTPYKIPSVSAPSVPSPSVTRLDSIQYYNSKQVNKTKDIFLNLGHVRKALCIRIMHSFQDGDNKTAYTIWVYDVESGKEWYAPVRYYRDFQDLRNATCRIYPFLSQIPFPSSSHWGNTTTKAFWDKNYQNDAATNIISSPTLKLLEIFLRSLCSMIYTGTLHPRSAEVAIHLQSFLGCDVCFSKEDGQTIEDVYVKKNVILPKPLSSHRLSSIDDKNERDLVKLYLKRSIQRYIHRIFLLPVLDQLITKFIDDFKSTTASINTGTNEKKNGNQNHINNIEEFKNEAQKAIDNVSNFLDQMQDLLWEGCKDDLITLSKRREFQVIQNELDHIKSKSNRETFLQEGIREQVEIEIYVPLRSAISRLLVYGWRNDDLEMQFKIQELKKHSQSFFRIQKDLQSPSDWGVCCKMLSDGVGRSTLPCEKLRAIVASAHEIARLSLEEQTMKEERNHINGSNENKNQSTIKELSADDFLPIFIYCFVQAELLRPSALCVLLRTLCDPLKKIGETGYYLASFESAVSYIHEFDLAEECSVATLDNSTFLSF